MPVEYRSSEPHKVEDRYGSVACMRQTVQYRFLCLIAQNGVLVDINRERSKVAVLHKYALELRKWDH